ADLARTNLGDRDLARAYYKKALELRADDRRALVALESLYQEANDAPSLLDILKRRVEVSENDAERKELLFREAKLNGQALANAAGAIEVYEAILEIALDPEAVSSLVRLYPEAGRYTDLVALYERQLEVATTDKPDLRVRLAIVLRENLRDVTRAFDELE